MNTEIAKATRPISSTSKKHNKAKPVRFMTNREPVGSAKLAFSASLFVLFLIVWVLLVEGGINPIFLPSPQAVASAFHELYFNNGFLSDLGVSIYRVGVGFLASAIFAIPIGVLAGSFGSVRSTVEPFLGFIRYMPATAFIPLLVLWIGIGDVQKFSVIFVGTFCHLTLLISASTSRVPTAYVESAIMLQGSRWKILRLVIWPAARPGIFDDLRVVLGWAWTYIVVAEMVAAKSGVGYVILKASRFLDTATMFVGILSIGLVGLLSDVALGYLKKILFPYLQRSRK